MRLKVRITVGLFCFLSAVLAACTPAGPATSDPGLPPRAVLEAQGWLAAQLGVGTPQVQIVEVEQAEWSDSCLGLGRANESCAQVITPGWRAVFEVDSERYELRTDETGAAIRVASPEGIFEAPLPGPPGSETPGG